MTTSTAPEALCTTCQKRKAKHGVAIASHEDGGGLFIPATYETLCTKDWKETDLYTQLKEKGALKHGAVC